MQMKQPACRRLVLDKASLGNRLSAPATSGLGRKIRDTTGAIETPVLTQGHDFSQIPIHAPAIMRGLISISNGIPSESNPSEGFEPGSRGEITADIP